MKSLMASAYSALGNSSPFGTFMPSQKISSRLPSGVQEVERAAAAALQVPAGLDAVSQRAADNLRAVGVDVGEGLHEFVAVLHLKGHLLHQAGVPRYVLRNIHAIGGAGDDEIVVGLVEPQESRLGTVGPLAARSYLAAQHLGVKLEGPLKIGNQNPNVSTRLI